MTRPNFDMHGRVALITGAARGIGLAIAETLAGAGASVAIQDVDLDTAHAAAERVARVSGSRVIALGGDIADLAIVPKLVDETVAQLGGFHVLVNNAAIQKHVDFLQVQLEDIERIVRADQIAPLLLSQRVIPIFKQQHFGRIINIGSIQQRGGAPTMLPYAMSKSALENQTVNLARLLIKDGVTVNQIAPGFFNTLRNEHHFRSEQDVVEKTKWVPMGRIGEPEDCAGVALLLASDASGYITGQTIFVDGGMSVR